MSSDVEDLYLQALRRLNTAEVARGTGRGYSTLRAYLTGTRRVTPAAVSELVAFLRTESRTLDGLAQDLESLAEGEVDGA